MLPSAAGLRLIIQQQKRQLRTPQKVGGGQRRLAAADNQNIH
jgi:hypothetical protein